MSEKNEWKSIDSAPKDGSRVLIWGPDYYAPITAQWYGSEGWKLDSDLSPFWMQPTHWMPLPAAPGSTSSAPGDAQDERQAFEAWGLKGCEMLDDPRSMRMDIAQHCAWEAWQARGRLSAPAAGDALELKRKTDLIGELSKIIHNMTVAQQAAWIEWRHGAGADAAMQWIENGLAGPGHIPDEDEPYGTEAQAYFDANQADPLPACHCGRPSNILHMGSGYCSNEHYRAALAAQVPQQGEA